MNRRVHATTRAKTYERLETERLRPVAAQPDYDTSYTSYREVAKDCLLSYHGNRYSVPHAFAGKRVVVKEPVAGGRIVICHQQEVIAEHGLATTKGAMVIDAAHYQGLPRRHAAVLTAPVAIRELIAGPGVGHHFAVPEVEVRPLSIYEEVSHVATV